MKRFFTRLCRSFMRGAACAWLMVFACGSNAAQTETKASVSEAKCCCLASFGDGFVADEADWPIQPAALPKYPEVALTGHWSAKVLLSMKIDLAGKPKSMRVEKAELSGGLKYAPGTTRNEGPIRHAFEVAMLEAAKQWRFKDCTVYGWPADRRAMVPVDFSAGEDADKSAATNAVERKH